MKTESHHLALRTQRLPQPLTSQVRVYDNVCGEPRVHLSVTLRFHLGGPRGQKLVLWSRCGHGTAGKEGVGEVADDDIRTGLSPWGRSITHCMWSGTGSGLATVR